MPRLEVLGFWFSPFAPSTLPRPQGLVAALDPPRRERVLRYLRGGKVLVRYPEASFCRFECGETAMGCCDLSDGRFVWPEGLAHYVERHDVRLPDAFVAHVEARGGEVAACQLPKAAFGLYDREPWLAWAKAQRACPDLDGFAVPDDETRDRIASELPGVVYDEILLCRGSTREVVLAVSGGIELRQVCAGARAPRRFAGWHEWPVVGEGVAAPALPGLRKPKPGSGSFRDFFASRPRGDGPANGGT